MKLVSIGTLLCAGLLCTQQGLAQSFPGSNFGAIPDGLPGTVVGRYGAPRDIRFDVNAVRTVTGVSVSFTASHNYVGDLRVTLIAPDGNSHLLFARTGATTATGLGFDSSLTGSYSFSDAASVNWWTGAATNPIPPGNYRSVVSGGPGVSNPPPPTSMNAQFAGSAANGQWVLRFEDGVSAIVGSVTSATLTLTLAGGVRLVSNANDSGAGSLRAAMLAATSGDVIQFDPSAFTFAQTLNLQSPLPTIDKVLAIQGPGADRFTVRRGDDAPFMRIFTITGGLAGVSLSGMTVSNGFISDFGSAIYSVSPLTLSRMHISGNLSAAGTVTVESGGQFIRSTFSGNRGSQGAILATGFLPFSSLRIEGCTISGNDLVFASGIDVNALAGRSFELSVINSTIAENRGDASGGNAIRLRASGTGSTARARIRNSIVAENDRNFVVEASSGGSVVVESLGFNLSDDWGTVPLALGDLTGAPRLGPLAPQGGGTPVHLLLADSPALDRGSSSGPVTDQRGLPMPFDIATVNNASVGGNGADIGAVEMQAIIVSSANDSGANTLRSAITQANSNGTGLDDILFDPAALGAATSIALSSALPNIASALTISGPGANLFTIRRGPSTPPFRVFTINEGLAGVAISGLTVLNGDVVDVGGFGGGISSASPLTLARVYVRNNEAVLGGGVALTLGGGTFIDSTFHSNIGSVQGGAIFSSGVVLNPLRLINSTVSGNVANIDGGVLHRMELCCRTSVMEVINSTITNNGGAGSAGIASVALGSGGNPGNALVTLRNSIVAHNFGPNLATFANGGASANITSRGHNLSNTADAGFLNQSTDRNNANAGLVPLALNGGGTPTHALLPTSDAIDVGSNLGSGVIFDQRGPGFARTAAQTIPVVPDFTDIGAFELRSEFLFRSGFE